MQIYYLLVDASNNIVGSGFTPDGTVPDGCVVCSQLQAQNPFNWAIVKGEIMPSPNVLANTQAAQIQILSSACAKQIISGFSSPALGTPNNYASGEIDQQNIVQSAQSTKGGLLSCANASGVWTRQPHTQAQAQQVLEDFVTARDAARSKLGALETQVSAATTLEAVQAILWNRTP